eukprot:scaffold11016_cov80-Skeletonema_marinoi.AAC.1
MDAKLSHCFSSDCISADAGVTDGGVDLAFDPPKPPPPPPAFFFCFFAAYKAVMVGLECCGQVKAAEWLAKKANHSSSSGDVAIMVMVQSSICVESSSVVRPTVVRCPTMSDTPKQIMRETFALLLPLCQSNEDSDACRLLLE